MHLSLLLSLSLSVLSALGLCSVLVMSVPWCSWLVTRFFLMCRRMQTSHLHDRWPHCFSVGVALQYSCQNIIFLSLPLVHWHSLSPTLPTFYDILWDPPLISQNSGPIEAPATVDCICHITGSLLNLFVIEFFCSWLWFVLYFLSNLYQLLQNAISVCSLYPFLKAHTPLHVLFFCTFTAHSSSSPEHTHFPPLPPMSLFSRVPK